MHEVAEALANLFADVFPDADDVARRTHLHDLAVVGNSVEGGVNQQSAFAEKHLDVERHLNVGGIHILVLQDRSIEFKNACFFCIHIINRTPTVWVRQRSFQSWRRARGIRGR